MSFMLLALISTPLSADTGSSSVIAEVTDSTSVIILLSLLPLEMSLVPRVILPRSSSLILTNSDIELFPPISKMPQICQIKQKIGLLTS